MPNFHFLTPNNRMFSLQAVVKNYLWTYILLDVITDRSRLKYFVALYTNFFKVAHLCCCKKSSSSIFGTAKYLLMC